MRTGGSETGAEALEALLRTEMSNIPLPQQRTWLREVELLLDGYATKPQLEAAARIREVLERLKSEMKG